MKVFILSISHKYGTDNWVFSTEEKAKARLYKYVQDWWDFDEDCPEDIDEAIRAYFIDYMYVEEYYSIDELEVDNPD